MIGICKFCNQEKRLIASHIIPKSFYRLRTYGRVGAITPATNSVDLIRYQNGLKEYLMCSECDRKLGELDAHTSNILFDEIVKHPFRSVNNIKTYLLKQNEFDYNKLRRFFISLAWRASISSDFGDFSLGKYEDVALKILKNEIPDDVNLFVPIVMRKNTQTPIDHISTWCTNKIAGKKACLIRFPDYEIKIITNTQYSQFPDVMRLYKSCLTPEEFLVMESDYIADYDLKWLDAIIKTIHPL